MNAYHQDDAIMQQTPFTLNYDIPIFTQTESKICPTLWLSSICNRKVSKHSWRAFIWHWWATNSTKLSTLQSATFSLIVLKYSNYYTILVKRSLKTNCLHNFWASQLPSINFIWTLQLKTTDKRREMRVSTWIQMYTEPAINIANKY